MSTEITFNNFKYAKTYKTKKNLKNAIKDFKDEFTSSGVIASPRYIIMTTDEGRFTALFVGNSAQFAINITRMGFYSVG